MVWKININGVETLLKRYGSHCKWDKLTLENNFEEVYRIELGTLINPIEKKESRAEFFFNNAKTSRIYFGNQFSFIEYIETLDQLQSLPNFKQITDTGIEKEVLGLYTENAKKIFMI